MCQIHSLDFHNSCKAIQREEPSHKPVATLIDSSSILSPIAKTGAADNQAPDSFLWEAINQACALVSADWTKEVKVASTRGL